MEAVRASGAIEAALAEARAHAVRGREALTTLPDDDSRRMLGSGERRFVLDECRALLVPGGSWRPEPRAGAGSP